jgi:hypothetical protein
MGDDRLAALIQTHVARYPASGVADIYKLLHQATFGPGHAVASKKAAREWLEQEAGKVGEPLGEPLIESAHPEGHIVRVHLRPYLAQGGKLDWLLDAFVRSAEMVAGAPELMGARWRAFAELCRGDGPLAGEFPLRELELFGAARAAERWPAVQHSPAFIEAYRPYYRVLVAGEASALCERLGVPFSVA